MSFSRRNLLQAGASIAAGALAGNAAAKHAPMPADTRQKQTFVPQENTTTAFSIADNLFWNDIMMEHAMFFTLLMPGQDLARPRAQAEKFQAAFARQLARSRRVHPDGVRAFNRSTIDLVKRFSDFKKESRELQATGKMRSLVWPLFFEHTAREADRFAARLELYNSGQIELDRSEVIDFWSKTMGEHSAFIAHLLDPDERELIKAATQMEGVFLNKQFANGVESAASEILDFKIAGENGIHAGQIKSIIPPPLASHVKREALKFIDELKRAV